MNGNLLLTRIVVGILFAFLLGLPLSSGSVDGIVTRILYNRYLEPNATAKKFDMAELALNLLPFVVGFSTTLILGIMDRFVSAARATFGLSVK